ncbi:hypothetical protein LOTGIDRAFT_160004 [Lottia gigantea]|uniref:C2 domain-containing protein n=1 Tax=Lottia gigantea TaxID=225164 RepID=V4AQR1_LOTGI|nr:hypothetical protein LOTGIDRAFT_160004 [Lottia gigantea]ESO96021.1 hypothetical protein LOTGIDRAFT_160004 [Lottia gigantea]
MEVFQQLKNKASQALPEITHVRERISTSLQESFDSIPIRWPNSGHRDEAFRRRAASYDEYYLRISNTKAALRRKEGLISPLINKFDRLEQTMTPKKMSEKEKAKEPNTSLRISKSVGSTSNFDFNERVPSCRDMKSVSSYDSGFRETSMFEFFIPQYKDSIADVELDTDQVQLTINHEHRKNALHVSIHRATLTFPNNGRIYAKLCLLPNKLQKKKGKAIDLAKAKRWEEDFRFTDLSIGQLETCSIKIKIYQENGFFKRPFLKYGAVIALKDVDITDFRTTVLSLTTITNQITHHSALRRKNAGGCA